MSKKRDSASTVTEMPSNPSAVEEAKEQLSNSPKDGEVKLGFTGLPLEEQRSNLIKIAIFLIGCAAVVFGLKLWLGW